MREREKEMAIIGSDDEHEVLEFHEVELRKLKCKDRM